MANNKFLKFYKGASAANAEVGAIWFDTTNRLIKVKIAESGDNMWQAYSGLQNAEWLSETKQLQLTKADGSKFIVDFSDVASAKGIGAFADTASNTSNSSVHARINQAFAEISTKLEAADQVVKSVDTTADAGVALVKDTDGKLSISVTEGAVAENNEAVVLGGQVYAAIDAAKTELAGQISGKNVDAQGDAYVNATAANNKVTVAATTKLSDAVALAETAVQEVVTGATNGTIKVDGTEVAVAGLQDAAYVTVESLNTTAQGYATTVETNAKGYADSLKQGLDKTIDDLGKELGEEIEAVAAAAKSYSIATVTGDELAGLGANVKEAYKLVDEDSAKAGEYIKIYKDSALQSVALNENQELVFTYLLADGSESVVPVSVASFLAESEFGNGLSVNSETGVVSVKVDAASESFLTVGADGIKLAGVQDAIDTAVAGAVEDITEVTDGIDERVKELEATKETVASALQADDITTGGANGTIAVKGADVAVKGLGSAAYTETSDYATAAQGELADSAVQSVAAGSVNGTIAVDGTDVAITGLKSAAFVETTAFDAAGSAAAAEAAANKYAEDLWVWVSFD